MGKISQEDYGRQVQAALSFLNGNYKEILTELQEQMRAQAEEMEFEKAAETRDLIESIRHIEDKQQMNKVSVRFGCYRVCIERQGYCRDRILRAGW